MANRLQFPKETSPRNGSQPPRQLDYTNPFQRPAPELDALDKKEGNRWVRYRWERRGNGFVEIAIDNQGLPIDISNPANWRSLADVYLERQTFEGIALVQTPESNIACITLRNVNRRFPTDIPDEFIPDIFFQHAWAGAIRGTTWTMGASGDCYVEVIPCGWRIIGTTRLTEPYIRIRKGMRDEFDPNPIDPEAGYEIRARTSGIIPIRSYRGQGNPLAWIDPTFAWIETHFPAPTTVQTTTAPQLHGRHNIGAAIVAGINSDDNSPLEETSENIALFCTALTFVNPSDYHGNPHNCSGIAPNFCLGWFEGLCAIKSLPWRQEVKERIAIWWSMRTTRDNYPGDGGVLHKLNHDIRERDGGITYRSVFKFAHARGWDGRED